MNFVISVVAPNALETLTDFLNELGLPLTVAMRAKGTAVKSMLELLGIESNERRLAITVANSEKTAQLIARARKKLHIGVPGHGIIISIPVKSIGGGKTLAYLNGENQFVKHTPEINGEYELITIISNEGHTDSVMNAARAAGARGGTVLHGKGTGAKGTPRFYNISIANEKEVILIVSSKEQKTEIMQSVLQKAGPDTDAGSIVFSLPVTQVAGFGFFEEA